MMTEAIDKILAKIIRWSFAGLVFFLPLVMWTRSSEVFELPKMLFVYAMTTIIVGLWLARMALRREILIRRTPLDIPILLFLISQMASTIYSIDPYVSWWGWYGRFHGGLVSTISYTLLYYAFVSNYSNQSSLPVIGSLFSVFGSKFFGYQSIGHKPINRKLIDQNPTTDNGKLITVILASGLIVSLYAILQHFGIDKNFWVQDVVNRVFSTQGQPNWLAAYLVMAMPLAWTMIVNSERLTDNRKQNIYKRRWPFTIHYSLFTILLLALLWTKSRSGLLGLAAADAVFWLVALAKIRTKDEGRRTKVKQFIFIHTLMVAVILATNNPGREWLLGKLQATGDRRQTTSVPALEGGITLRKSEQGGTESGDIRRLVWSGAIQLVKQRPIFGFGPETFGETYWRVRPKEHNLTSEWNFLYNKAHNEWLNLAANTGGLGLGAHLLLLGWFGVWIVRSSRASPPDWRSAAIPSGLPRRPPRRTPRNDVLVAILAAVIGVETVNFFGFSTVTVGAYRYLFMGLAVSILKKKLSDRVFYNLISKVNRWQYLGLATIAAGAAVTVGGVFLRFAADLEYNRGRAYADAGYIEEAVKPLMRAANWVPGEPVFRVELGETEGALAAVLPTQKTDNSEQITENPDIQRTVLPTEGQSLLEAATDLKNDSLTNFEIVRKQSPYNLGFLRTQAKVLFNMRNIDPTLAEQALQLMKVAMEMAPTNPQLPYSLGTMLTKMGQDEEAAVYYNKAVELKPDYQEARKAMLIYE